jgi:hypothetical protein
MVDADGGWRVPMADAGKGEAIMLRTRTSLRVSQWVSTTGLMLVLVGTGGGCNENIEV